MLDDGYEIISARWSNAAHTTIRVETRYHGVVLVYNDKGREELWAHAQEWITSGGTVGDHILVTPVPRRDALAELDDLKARLRAAGIAI